MRNLFTYKQRLIHCLGNYNNKTILDYGCGNGDFIELLLSNDEKPKLIYAVDSSEEKLTVIHNRFSIEIKKGIIVTRCIESPSALQEKFDGVICHNVLECIDNKLDFINCFEPLLADEGIFILSHHDFDSAIYNSHYKELTRQLVHHFADTQQSWMRYSDGQMGRKIFGLINQSVFREFAEHNTWRLVDTRLEQGSYGLLMANMLIDIGRNKFTETELKAWLEDLEEKNKLNAFYFAIDLVLSIISKKRMNE